MKIQEALELLSQGKYLTRYCSKWDDVFICSVNGQVYSGTVSNVRPLALWTPLMESLIADDWEPTFDLVENKDKYTEIASLKSQLEAQSVKYPSNKNILKAMHLRGCKSFRRIKIK